MRVLVERKTAGNLVDSYRDGRWQRQMPGLVESDLPILLIEGEWEVQGGRIVLGGQVSNWSEDRCGDLVSFGMGPRNTPSLTSSDCTSRVAPRPSHRR